ncbi:Hint domain-containing protein [Polynucleobacter asymbioticus]|jgi:hypothetical protein|uniref:Hedgehog/Intein (Hint) domain-containing protein n=1 Tax=Polynucleobacter asymbioticus TaxID=576611 RepID=A0AAC9IPN6_9BURK|nr:Hint domain-containing protein [Polynucleobacter asymbioticus]APB98203.1 hypothetical protein A4F89_02050 [Polynucleobacter asymbioticus]APC00489.1 hypothetical protein AOC25_02055 [Polynucleobacter asymbioticus]
MPAPTTEYFAYNFTDSANNVFNVTVTASNATTDDPNTYLATAISGTVNGIAVDPNPSSWNGADNLINVSATNPSFSLATGVDSSGLSFSTNAGDWTIYNTGTNDIAKGTYTNGYIPSAFQVTLTTACFTPGTLISTPTGSTPVQDLQIGDLILNHVGDSIPVKWIGTQRIHPAFAGDKLPICIRQGALGDDLPLRDLYVSPGHALYIDHCLLIDAKALINGTTITQVTQWDGDVQYLHIETESHEIILAEGTPAETFMDNVSRACFNNYSEYQALYPEAHEMIELDIPRVSHQRQLPNAVKAKLEAISEVLMGEGHGVKERMVG